MGKDEKNASETWNVNELLQRVDNDRDLLHELLTIFKEDFPKTTQSLREAVQRGDLKSAATLGHTLKGMLASLCLTRGAASAAKIEQVAAAGQPSAVAAAFEAFDRESPGLMQEVDAYMAGVHS